MIASDPSLSPYTVASNGILQSIAAMRPRSLDELLAIPDVRRWQVRDHGEAILKVLDHADPK